MSPLKSLLPLLMFLCAYFNVSAQVTGVVTVNGDLDKYYPVTFFDGGWSNNVATELEIGRSLLARDSALRGAIIAKFRFHVTNWGNGAAFIDADIRQYTNVNRHLIAGWKDASGNNPSYSIVIWLRGKTTYPYKSNYPVTPTVYDGIQNALPYEPASGNLYGIKTTVDNYVNSFGMSYSSPAYFMDPGVNFFVGKVGIGTTNVYDYKLAVAGKMIAEKIKVSMKESWPDYVFQDDYKLASLQEIEQYISRHKRLPGFPSAKEVAADGVDLGEMNRKLLEKVEELTLHIIEMKKEIEQLKTRQ